MSRRDRWLLALVPALCVALWSLFQIWLPHRERTQALEEKVQAARAIPGGSLPSVDLDELERLRTALAKAEVSPTVRVAALRWSGLAESLERRGLRLVRERALEQGMRALELEGGYLALVDWLRGLIQDPAAPAPRRVELLEARTAEGALRWSAWLP
jgi:type II secretory pathway component PulM